MRRFVLLLGLALCLGALGAAPAAAFGLQELDVRFENEAGNLTLQAGSHPFAMSTGLGFTTFSTPEGEVPEGEIRNLTIEQVEGLVGSQTAVETCSEAQFNTRVESRPLCPDESAVGYAAVEAEFDVIPPEEAGPRLHVPVYNVDPPPGVAATLGFIVLNVPVTIDVRVSPAPPHNLVAELRDVSQAVLIYRSEVVLWGNPADEVHDELRGNCLGEVALSTEAPVSKGTCEVDLPDRAFLTLPRACAGPLDTLFDASSWAGEQAQGTALTHDESEPKGIEGCEGLEFDPADRAISTQPTTQQASSPTGLGFDLDVDDEGLTDPSQRAQSDIRKVVATLPEEMALNPSAANGLEACSSAQYAQEGLRWTPNAGCPQASKVGAVEVESPLLKEPLQGSLYVAAQNENPFNSTFALYLVIRNERYGVLVKQAGRVDPDPNSGQLTSTFEGIPQLPFSDLKLSFDSGPRAPLATPAECGTHTATATLTPWSGGASITESSSFELTSGPNGTPCRNGAGPFSPSLGGGSSDPQAGAYSPFHLRLTRNEGEQAITRFDATLPAGVLGKLAGLGRCSDASLTAAATRSGRAELAAPSCPASARIGSVLAGAGLGPFPTYVGGSLYLAGPHDGAPLSVAAIVPAVAGPFDLGTVITREALALDPKTAEVEVSGASPQGQIPRLIQGVPVQLRELRIAIDRPGFTLNATSCEPKLLQATLFGFPSTASLAERYQASGCRSLAYRPKLSLKLRGGTERGENPSLRAVLTQPPGQANTARAVVALPKSAFLDQSHIRTICTRVQFAAKACPKGSVYGFAKAETPLLDGPLTGPVYLRASENPLPDLVAALKGPESTPVEVELVGRIDSVRGGIRTSFESVPDAPVTRFALTMRGGNRGLIVNSRDLCRAKSRADVKFVGQNGYRTRAASTMKVFCAARKR